MWGADGRHRDRDAGALAALWGIDARTHFDILANVSLTVEEPIRAGQGECEVLVFDEARVRRAREALLDEGTAQDTADLFRMLAHPTRLQILRALAREELCVCDLGQVLGLSVSATSYQLQALRRAKLVRFRSEGKLAYYRLADSFVLALLEDALRHFAEAQPR